jgi:hypothetical protein
MRQRQSKLVPSIGDFRTQDELWHRRRWLKAAGVSVGLLPSASMLRAASPATPSLVSPSEPAKPTGLPSIRACIQIFYYGGPSHLETYDLKPHAPAEVRGEFQPIATSAPGVWISEHLPHMAAVMHHAAIVRSVHHEARLHDSASIHSLTGRPLAGPDRELFAPQPQDFPSFGSTVAYARRDPSQIVPFASLPFSFRNVHDVPCQGAGFLGSEYDPLRIEMNPERLEYDASQLRPAADLSADRRDQRRALWQGLQRVQDSPHPLLEHYQRAYELLASKEFYRALDVSQEPMAVRERYGFGPPPAAVGAGGGGGNGAEMGYGSQMRGQNLLLARRLVEAGVPFVTVYDYKQQGQNWDAHFQVAQQHKTHLLPRADRALAALILDLEERGLLDSTLIIAMGEFGRTPHINAQAGRDHWPDCYSVLLAGGGVRGGSVYGSSDAIGAYPATDPVTPGDLAATVFWRFGLDPESVMRDRLNRPFPLADGHPISAVFG